MSERNALGREPIEIIEIDQDFCTLTYGVAPCAAVLEGGGHKCFNTLGTCQSIENYDKGTLTLRFCSNRVEIPQDGNYYFPYLQGVKVKPCSINPGGGNENLSPLGRRATIDVTFSDHPHTDRVVDPYLSERLSGAAQADGVGYDPFDRSTFWAKWRARNPYYLGRTLRYISGYLKDGQVVDAVTRTFVITGFKGPNSNDQVTISGKDILTKAQNEKAKAPAYSAGKLLANLSDSATSFDVSALVADDYPASGYVRISDEVMSFTRSGTTFTVVRAQRNTAAQPHNEGDRVQLCLEYVTARPDDIVYDLLHNYAGIADEYLDIDGWADEVDTFLPRGYSALITEPTGVQELLGEVCEQMYFYIWFDERADLVRLRAVRPAQDDPVTDLDDDQNLLQDSVTIEDATDQLLTRVVVNYGQINPARDLEEPSNYSATEIVISGEELEDRQDESRTKVIYSRWISDGAAATELGEKILSRYSGVPKKVRFSLDAKDRDLWVGDFCSITHRRAVDAIGNPSAVNLQIMEASESIAGTTFTYMGQEFVFEEPVDPTIHPLEPLEQDEIDLNIRTYHDTKYPGELNGDETIIVTLSAGRVFGSSSTSTPAITVGDWPEGVRIFIIIESGAKVLGHGGKGGLCETPASTYSPVNSDYDGLPGGVAIHTSRPIYIENYGYVAGGGGGGGGMWVGVPESSVVPPCSGGGGAGKNPGDGGDVVSVNPTQYPGDPGTETAGGDGGNNSGFMWGGDGGDPGQDGGDAGGGNPGLLHYYGVGGAAGAAIDGVSYVTFVERGTILGPEIN